MPNACALGCGVTNVATHSFPNPDKFLELFNAWVKLVGGKLETASDYKYYKNKRICDIHFAEEHRNRCNRLNVFAVPTLHLPDTSRAHDAEPAFEAQETAPRAVVGPQLAAPPHASTILAAAVAASIPPTTTPNPCAVTLPPPSGPSRVPHTDKDENNRPVTEMNVFLEHNYSAWSRSSRKSSIREALGTSCSYAVMKNFQRKTKYLQNEIVRLRKRSETFKDNVVNAKLLSEDVAFQQVVKHMTKPAQIFVQMQQKNAKKPKGRRYTLEEKIMSLSLYKKSPKGYKLLCKYFTLPSSKAMKRLLSQIKISPGINNIVFEKIKKTMEQRERSDRLCSLMFDEMSITPHVLYSAQKDKLEGFSTNNEKLFADHVLTFMVKGVKNNFKQPIAYYFTNSLNNLELKSTLKTVIKHAVQSGLIIVNTVCDQSAVNVRAISELVAETKATYLRNGKEWRGEVVRIAGQDIVPLYDTPHLMKGLRNNLINKDLRYKTNNEEKIIKWHYYQMVYDADKSYGELRLLNKVTEEHVNPEKINKMRVKSATQLFSHSVAVVANHLTARGDVPSECKNIIDFTLLLDNLFDSLNVSSLSIPNGKVFRGPVKRNSPHHELWLQAKNVLRSVKYIRKVNVADKIRLVDTVVPSVKNFIKTIEGMEHLWKVLSSKYGLDAVLTRNFNQDPLENFFGNIRSYGARNIAPNTVSFEGAYKSLLLNNYSSPHSRGANCEEDTNECLQTLDFFLREDVDTPDVSEATEVNINIDAIYFDPPNNEDTGQRNYVCGWVLKQCLKIIAKGGCQNCRMSLLDNTPNATNAYTRAKEYKNRNWLCYPNHSINQYFKDLQNIAVGVLKKNVPKTKLRHSMISLIDLIVKDPFQCDKHKTEFKKMFIEKTLNVIIYSWCRSINRILSGKIKYDGDDETKVAAQNYFNKHKNYKNRK